MQLDDYFNRIRDLVNAKLDELLVPETGCSSKIYEAMRYSVFAGGKRLRPILLIATAESLGCEPESVLPAACAVEMIHTYSLIHDDLPALDNDELRRGKPTNHTVFGEAMAILAGDALLNSAFEVILGHSGFIERFGCHKVLKVSLEIAEAAGAKGMIGGQVVDILYEGKPIDEATLKYMHSHKTGALLIASVRSGAILGNATQRQLNLLTEYAKKVGLMYQIIDDILDVTGDENTLGKPVGSDLRHKKNTYPAFYGPKAAKIMASRLAEEAIGILKIYDGNTEFFNKFTEYLVSRQN